jgi:hypothetical protein
MATDLAIQCHILTEARDLFSESDMDDGFWIEFFRMNNLGVPVAVSAHYGLATPTEKGLALLAETWQALCRYADVEPDVDVVSLEDLVPWCFS